MAVSAVGAAAISTNTLLTEGDRSALNLAGVQQPISTNTLLTEGDPLVYIDKIDQAEFQPTPSSRRVTRPPSSGKGGC